MAVGNDSKNVEDGIVRRGRKCFDTRQTLIPSIVFLEMNKIIDHSAIENICTFLVPGIWKTVILTSYTFDETATAV